jgi:YYY domain-containing protein
MEVSMLVSFSDVALQAESTTPTPEPLTYDQPVGTLPIVDDARWSSSLTDNSFMALIVWILLLVVIQAATWPLVKRLFRRFPDRGWGFARLTTITIAGFLVWFPAALEITEFRAIWCWVAVLAVAAASWLWTRRLPPETQPETHSRIPMVGAEVVFWLVFVVFLLFRFINPDSYEPIWGGEKAMEFAHINSILRSAHFPPVDPWYGGGYLNYYYYGSYLVAFLIKLTGIPSEIAFNLSLPLVLALLATGMFSVGAAIGRSFSKSSVVTMSAGIAATLFSVFIGNMVAAARIFEAAFDGAPRDKWDFWVWGPTRIFPKWIITEFPFFAGLYGDLHAHTIALPFTVLIAAVVFALFQERDRLSTLAPRALTIDLAPRVLFLGVLLGTLFMTNAWDAPTFGVLCGIGLIAALVVGEHVVRRLAYSAVAVAAVGVVAYIAIFPFNQHYVALFSEIDRVTDKTPLLPVEAHLGGFLLIMTAGFAVFGFREKRRGQWLLDPLMVLPAIGFLLCLRWYAVDQGASLRDFADYATVILVGGVWLAISWLGMSRENDFRLPNVVVQAILGIGGLVAVGGLVTGRPVFALYVAIGASAGVAWLVSNERSERFLFGMIAIGTLLGALLELIFLVDDLRGGDAYRMNTMFKFYNQLWTLFALASAGCVARMISELLPPAQANDDAPSTDDPELTQPDRIRRGWSRAGLAISVGVVVLGLAYPVQAIGPRLDTRLPHPESNLTLNAYSWMNYATIPLSNGDVLTYNDDLAAIEWFNDDVPGNPVIAEASFGAYRCNGSRFSIATGLPSVIGWERHEQQQRDRKLLPQRSRDLRDLYELADPTAKMELIDKYDIEYIVVGATERVFPMVIDNQCVPQDVSAGIATFESMVGSQLEVVFVQGSTTVYRVVG